MQVVIVQKSYNVPAKVQHIKAHAIPLRPTLETSLADDALGCPMGQCLMLYYATATG